MIKTFQTDRNTLFFPTRWANSVARWILGLMSKEGTIKITNTPNPSDEGGCSIDVNMDVVYEEIKRRALEDSKKKGGDDETIDQNVEENKDEGGGEGEGGETTTPDPLTCVPLVEDDVIVGLAFAKMSSLQDPSVLDEYDGKMFMLDSASSSGAKYGAKPILDNGGNVTGITFGTDAQIDDSSNLCKTVTLQGVPKWCVKPTVGAGGAVTSLTFGTEATLDNGSATITLDLSNVGGGGAYAVKPTFDNDGVLQKLEFGSDTNITAKYDGAALVASARAAWEAAVAAANAEPDNAELAADRNAKLSAYQSAQTAVATAESAIKTVNTQIGCPFNS